MPGPAKDPNALRRSRDGDKWLRLPAHGLTGEYEVPDWPPEAGPVDMTEQGAWVRLWREQPAAWVWLRRGLRDQVALYCRLYVRCIETANVAQMAELRRLADTLLLTTTGQAKHMVVIDQTLDGPVSGLDAPEVAKDAPTGEKGNVRHLPSARDRFGDGGSR